ncbi:unnamed protein product [Oncorhynchus mykiss]|uniref:PGC-1 and ERR-induced regulator in muscle protein 1 n=1 Tax=Oncorhynchus mykiss TaxID=8022 RepID=A0A060WZB0_ONCMY|nr:unnamed protein product [Oncorhynchus mykiss]
MDDLDHSVHIAERDWDSFYKESEECSLPQPELAGSDDLGLSDEEPEDSVCPVEDFICTDLPVKICESGSEETQLNYPLSLTEEEGGALLDRVFDNSPHAQKESDSGYYGENRESGYFEENSLTTELVKDTPGETAEQNTKETSRNEDITKNLGSVPESSSNKCIANKTAILCERHAIVAPREEKERWFVTVNESQAPHRVHAATAVKKKRRKKKTCRNSVPRGHHTSEGPDPPPESESEIDIDGMEESNRQETMNDTSYDSEEEYVSATEMEDTNIPSSEIDSTLSASLPLQTPTANSQPLIQEDCLNCPLLSQREGYENTADQAYIESVRTCPSTGHSNSNPIMSEQSSVPADSKHSPDSHMTNETPAHRAGEPLTVWEHLPQTNTSEDQPPLPHPEVTVTPTENPETSYNASDPTRPVYAISAFWDEMEKLTIKDILHLRVCRSPSPPKETLHPQESDNADMLNSSLTDIEEYYSQDSSLMDTSDTADSDYFTHNDDSPKPDRSSCEFSTFSDFDEEYMPFFGTSSIPSPELGNFERRRSESPCSGAISQEETDSNMRNAQALEVEMELKDMLEEAEKSLFLNSCQDLDFAENPVLAVIDRISRMPSPILPNTDILDERYRITFPELYEYLFTEDVLSVYESLMSTSVAECCYDYSLSKYGAGVLFPPLVQQSLHGEGEPVPIFSCSRSAARDLRSPELEDFLFPQQDTYLESEEDDCSPIRVRGWTGNWKSLLSLRRIRFPGMGSTSSSWCWRSGAWMSPAVADTIVNEATRISPPPPEVIQLGHQIFRQLSEKQRRFKSLQTTVSVSKKDGILFSLKQSDMCLVCIAFASWVLRSADPMAADTWKAALLANVSAISAIQYLRRYVVKRREAGDLNDSTEDKA